MIEPNILILALGGTLILWHCQRMKKKEQAFKNWAEKDRQASTAFQLIYALHEAGVERKNPVFKKAMRGWRTLQKESKNLLDALSPS